MKKNDLPITMITQECHGILTHHILIVLHHIQTNNKKIIQAPCYLTFVSGIHQWLVNSPHKKPAMSKAFSCHNAIIK